MRQSKAQPVSAKARQKGDIKNWEPNVVVLVFNSPTAKPTPYSQTKRGVIFTTCLAALLGLISGMVLLWATENHMLVINKESAVTMVAPKGDPK